MVVGGNYQNNEIQGERMFREVQLKNNLTVVYEKLPFVRSVSFGLWIGTGSP